MYHRFEENKYPSTNIRMNIFLEHIAAIKNNGFEFYNPKLFSEEFDKPKDNKKILLTIDDAFLSFYENAWPIIKKNEIPFILFVSTEPIGKKGYMTWDQIKEIEKEKFAFIGNHSHTHEYLINFSFALICLKKHPISFKLFNTISSGSPLSNSTISCSFLDNFSKANLILTTFKGHGTDLRSKCFKEAIKILYQIIY